MMRMGMVSGLMLMAFAASLAAIAGDAPARVEADLLPVDGRDARLGLHGKALMTVDELGPRLRVEAIAPVSLRGELLRVDACEGTVGWIRLESDGMGRAQGSLVLEGFGVAPDCHPGDPVVIRGTSGGAAGLLGLGS